MSDAPGSSPAPLRGELRPPGDKSSSHRALLFAGFAEGTSTLHGVLRAGDTQSTIHVLRALGAVIEERAAPDSGDARDGGVLLVTGRPQPLSPEAALDCGNAGTLTRLLLGVLAGREGAWELRGDASLSSRPMGRVVEPLRALGAEILRAGDTARDADAARGANVAHGADELTPARDAFTLPLSVRGAALHGGTVRVEIPSAQVKSALLLAGLRADAPLTVQQSTPTRDETERMLPRFGARVERRAGEATVFPGALRAAEVHVPADASAAIFPLLAALLVPGSAISLRDVDLSPRRTGFLRALERADANVLVASRRNLADGLPLRSGGTARTRSAEQVAAGECGDLIVEAGPLRGFDIEPADVPDLIDELPALTVAACAAEGPSHFAGLAELRHKESDRLREIALLAVELGAEVEASGDALTIHPRGPLRAPHSVQHDDHRVAMARAVAQYAVRGCAPASPDSAAISYPRFADDLAALGAG
ncbi:MAG: 3-phosphoshikimate 1-carboxyvinyltransferase [Planctomycetota bacterium]|nr:MAG: 3-phosphoshikimate 1-carboxyvinyltransferase [Planctomycetota bacterium]